MTVTEMHTADAMDPAYEAGLQWLLELIQGTRWPYSPGLTSFDRPDLEAQGLHRACLELERRGKIRRVFAQDELVGWMPVSAHEEA